MRLIGDVQGAEMLTGIIGKVEHLHGDMNKTASLEGSVSRISTANNYTGEYEATPSKETQVLLTENKVLAQNITINPIPSNYGLITWDGSTLTVS